MEVECESGNDSEPDLFCSQDQISSN